MPRDEASGQWKPALSPKQTEVLAACLPSEKNIILLNGPRKSGKTIGILHAVCQHAWSTNKANICILTVTQSAGSDSGPWEHLTETYLPEWIGDPETGEGGNFGMDWIKKPFIQSTTKKPTCVVTNAYGTKSKISLESLKDEKEVEKRFKGKEYSMIWVSEASNFKQRKTFDSLKQCLRMKHLTPEQHLLLMDTNPAEEGMEHWLYKLFYEFRTMSEEQVVRVFKDKNPDFEGEPDIHKLMLLQRRLQLFEFTLDDNTFLSQDQRDEVFSDYVHDSDVLARYYYGRWVTATSHALFYEVFRPQIHVIPPPGTNLTSDPNPEEMVPEDNCDTLITGWDPGDSVNSAAYILEKVTFVTDHVTIDEGQVIDIESTAIKYLDELVITGTSHNLAEFVAEFMLKMEEWVERIHENYRSRGLTPPSIKWHHWSDRSVFERQSTESQRYLAQVIYDASVTTIRKEDIALVPPILVQAADRSPGSLPARIDLWKRKLHDKLLFFSGTRCPKLVQMNKSLSPPKTGTKPLRTGDVWKHPFDAASYPLASECYHEMNHALIREVRRQRRGENATAHVAVAY